jgi:glycosyltransferase involved in cell wall biosynthesis
VKQNIAMISEHASPLAAAGGVDAGGQNIYVACTARHLAAQGYAVDVFTRRDGEDQPAVVDWLPGIRVVHVRAGPAHFVRKESLLPFMHEFARAVVDFAVAKTAQGTPYAVCHAHFFMSGPVAQGLKRELGIPYVVTFHALGRVRLLHQPHDEFPPERCALEQAVIDTADAIVAECPQDGLDLQRHYRTPASRIWMIPCGFDPEELAPVDRVEARGRLGLPANRPIVLQLGRMVPRKGVETVIRALALVERRYDLRPLLVIVGGESRTPDPALTPEIGRLARVAVEERVAHDVLFVGQRPRHVLRYFYSAADVFVTMPWYEPFGITPVEAMACGVPVTGERVGGIQYSVEDGRTGFLVEPRNAEALARRLAHFFSNPSIPRLLGKRARRRACERFTWERVAQLLASAYADVALGARNSGRIRATTSAAKRTLGDSSRRRARAREDSTRSSTTRASTSPPASIRWPSRISTASCARTCADRSFSPSSRCRSCASGAVTSSTSLRRQRSAAGRTRARTTRASGSCWDCRTRCTPSCARTTCA